MREKVPQKYGLFIQAKCLQRISSFYEKTIDTQITGPFRRGVLLHADMPTHTQKHLEVYQITCANQTFDYTFFTTKLSVFDQHICLFSCYH